MAWTKNIYQSDVTKTNAKENADEKVHKIVGIGEDESCNARMGGE